MMSSDEKMSSGPRLDELPIDAIQSLVLACIDVRACGRLSLASTGVRDVVVTAEQTWQRHLGSAVSSSRWSRAPFASYAAFLLKTRTACVECRRPTAYEHLLLEVRVCEPCERAFADRYALCSHGDAALRYGDCFDRLDELPSVRIHGARLWLRSAVDSACSVEEQEDERVDRCSDADENDAPSPPRQARAATESLAARKEQRKAEKKIAKQAQRERRAGRGATDSAQRYAQLSAAKPARQKANRRSHADHARIAERTATDPVTSDRCGALVSALVLADDPELTLARFGKYAGLF